MTTPAPALPHGFAVRLHDGVSVGELLVSGTRVVRIAPVARDLIDGRRVMVTSASSAVLAARLLDLDLADPLLDGIAGPGLDEVTIVVPVRDGAAGVDRLLAAMGGLPCVVVDDASRDADELASVVRRHGASLVRLDHNMGPAAARNIGLRQVRTRFVAFVDCDVSATSGDLARLLCHLSDPGLAAVAPRVLSRGGRGWLARYEAAAGALDLGPVPATTRPWSAVTYVPSACLVARVDALGDGFDPMLRSGEDVDLVWRLQESGRRVRYAAEVAVGHDVRPSAASWLRRKAFYGSSAAPLAARHGDRVAPAAWSPVTAAAVAGVLVQRRWSVAGGALCAALVVRDAWTTVPDLPTPQRRRLVGATAVATARQVSGLALRHWSPGALALCLVSARARRVVGALALIDGVLAYRTARPGLDPVRFVLARRAEHLAYGVGVWGAAVRARSARSLVPRWLPTRRRRS